MIESVEGFLLSSPVSYEYNSKHASRMFAEAIRIRRSLAEGL